MEFKPRIIPLGKWQENDLYCRVMSGSGRDRWVEYIRDNANREADASALGVYYSHLIAQCLANAGGELIFGTDLEANEKLDAVTQEGLFKAIMEANGLGPKAADAEKKG